jgi:AraC-like DNA-binding protein
MTSYFVIKSKVGAYMNKKKKEKLEFRYYSIPQNEVILALLGEKWIQCYGKNIKELHFHNLLEIGYCYWGEGELVLDSEVNQFFGDTVSIIPKNFPHTTNCKLDTQAKWEYLYVDVEAFLYSLYDKNSLFADRLLHRINKRAYLIGASQNESMVRQIQELIEEMRNKRELYLEAVKGLLFTLLIQIARMDDSIQNNPKLSTVKVPQIQRALDYVYDNYYKSIPIEKLAEECHISETHFRRLFSSTMKMTPVEYINLVRVQNACEIMKKTQDSMEEIAVKVGFQTISTYNRNFKKYLGISPYQWKMHPDNFAGKLQNCKILVQEGW